MLCWVQVQAVSSLTLVTKSTLKPEDHAALRALHDAIMPYLDRLLSQKEQDEWRASLVGPAGQQVSRAADTCVAHWGMSLLGQPEQHSCNCCRDVPFCYDL